MMTLSVHFYGAWNHGQATKLNIGVNEESWKKGLVAIQKKDRWIIMFLGKKKIGRGHSILIVGYDDDIEIVTKQKMTDGTIKGNLSTRVPIYLKTLGDCFLRIRI